LRCMTSIHCHSAFITPLVPKAFKVNYATNPFINSSPWMAMLATRHFGTFFRAQCLRGGMTCRSSDICT
jgi:hypothetical protein